MFSNANIQLTETDGWTKAGDGVWSDGEGWTITAVAGRRGPRYVVAFEGRSLGDPDSSITGAKRTVAVQKALRAGRQL